MTFSLWAIVVVTFTKRKFVVVKWARKQEETYPSSEENEQLAEAVRDFPCLYDKSNERYFFNVS